MSGGGRERGLALVVVLWVIAALSLIAGAMLAATMTSAKIGHNAWAQLEVRTAADTAVQQAILSLFDPADPAILDGRERRSQIGDVTVTLSLQDQYGLIDINYAGAELLKNLFGADGVEAETAATLANRIVDWRSPATAQHPDVSGESGAANVSFRPRGAPFQSVDELRLVAGMTPEIFARVSPTLTVYSHRADFDMRVAPRQVLETIPGTNQASADAMVTSRTGSLARRGHAFAIVATAERDRMRFSRRAVILLTGDPARPYWVLDWR